MMLMSESRTSKKQMPKTENGKAKALVKVSRETKPLRRMSANQQAFVQNIGKGMNGTAAYMDAYGITNENAARAAAARLLAVVSVRAAVDELQKRASKRAEIDVAGVLRRLNRIATKAERQEQYTPAIQSITLLGKHLGMFKENNNTTINIGFAQQTGLGEVPDTELQAIIALRLKKGEE